MKYGVTFDGTNSAGTRTYDAVGKVWQRSSNSVAGQDDFANLAPFNVKECITQYNSLTGKREVLAYKGDANWDSLVAAKTGDRMIEFPCFWYSRPSKYEFIVSDRPEAGFKPSPMHYHNGSLYRTMRIGKFNLDNTYTSQVGTYPLVSTNMNTFRNGLRAKGQYLMDYDTWCSLAMLMMVKYANMNVQATVGSGRNSGNATIASGGTDSVLGLDGSATDVTANESVLTMGIENLFSNVWKYMDGLYGYQGYLYHKDLESMTSDPVNANELITTYDKVGTAYPTNASGSAIGDIVFDSGFDWMQFPITSGPPSPSGDVWWSTNGFNCVFVGGDAWGGSPGGLFTFAVNVAVGYVGYYIGAVAVEFGEPDLSTLYINTTGVYGYANGTFGKVANDFSQMTDAQKQAAFEATEYLKPSVAQLETLNDFTIATYSRCDYPWECTVLSIPQPQTITPKGRIPLLKYNKIRQVTITGGTTGDGVVKIAMTKDNSTYQVYDTVNQEWKTINIADIGTAGMSLTDVSTLTSAEWIAYDCMDSGIGFAYYLEIASTSDTAYTDELSLNVELFGEMKSIIKGTDFDYSYPSNYVLQVKLYKNGDFRINYNPGPPSTTLDIPTVSRALEYNGQEQSAPIANYDPTKMSMIGTTAATNAGVYTVVISPNVGYEWSDLSTDPKTLTWTIIKADSNLTLTPSTLTLAVGASDTITAAFDGDGTLAAVPSDTNVSVTVSGNDIVVTGVAAGSDTVTASVSATDNWNADMATAVITVS